jgi:hypothetical protein
MAAPGKKQKLFEGIVKLRRAERKLPGDRDISAVRIDLEESLGETVSPAFAGRALGVSHTSLSRWIESGDVPSVLAPSGRKAIPVASLAGLYEAVERERAMGARHALEAVFRTERERARNLRPARLVDALDAGGDPHLAAELRNRVMHGEVAYGYPGLSRAVADEALALIRRWRSLGRIADRYADAWEEILERPIADIRKALLADTPWGRDLRQNSPFAGLLSEAERLRILEEVG